MANTITSAYFLSIFDEFASVSGVKIEAFIGIASMRVDPPTWGTSAPYATALLTAHMIASGGGMGGKGGGVGGVLTSQSVGDVSRGYSPIAQAGNGDDAMMTTRYGIEFVALRRETIGSFTSAGPDLYPSFDDSGCA